MSDGVRYKERLWVMNPLPPPSFCDILEALKTLELNVVNPNRNRLPGWNDDSAHCDRSIALGPLFSNPTNGDHSK